MRFLITPKELDDRGLWWDNAIPVLRIDPLAITDDKLDYHEELTLTEEQAREIGLITPKGKITPS